MSGITGALDEFSGAMSGAQKGLNKVSRIGNQGGRILNTATGFIPNGASASSDKVNSAGASSGVLGASYPTVLGSPVVNEGGRQYHQTVAPAGTRMIIPETISSTKQERYLGENAVLSILNLKDKKEGVGNIVVIDPKTGEPSLNYYDVGSNGELFIKGTKIPANVKASGDNASIRLSEEEYQAVVNALEKKKDVQNIVYYKTSKEAGEAEESTQEKGSWFSRNWWILGLGLLATFGVTFGGVALYNKHQKKKEQKELSSLLASLSGNTSTNSSTNNLLSGLIKQPTGSTLAQAGSSVNTATQNTQAIASVDSNSK